jgi:hypothetical protein
MWHGVGKTGVAIAVERRAKTAGKARLAVIPRAKTATSEIHRQRDDGGGDLLGVDVRFRG